MRRLLTLIIGILSFSGNIFAADFPFTDVTPANEYYSSVKFLFDNRIVSDDGSHLFHPNDPIDRDAFVGLSVSVSCKKCITPSAEDIIKYQISPFIDLGKTNPYFYCIAYASEKNIVQGYILDNTGKASCQDNKSYSSTPFCESNKTTRIEAAGMLLRQAHLWDDTLNSQFQKKIEISDVTNYWYGYAEKGIQVGIISLKDTDKIYPDENISRGEFAMMASKILSYNQCSISDVNNNTQSQILLLDSSGKEVQKSTIPSGSNYSLVAQTGNTKNNGNNEQWNYIWKLTNPSTGETKTGSGKEYPIGELSCGQWVSELGVIDPSTGNTISTSSSTFYIDCGKNNSTNSSNLSVNIHANPISTFIGKTIDFTPYISGGEGKLQYKWDFGDGTITESKGPTGHAYKESGIYGVSLTIIDSKGNVAQSKIVITISGDRDSDDDGVFDNDDICPYVYGEKDNNGCPKIVTNPYDKIIREKLGDKTIRSSKVDTDSDGILDDGDENGDNIDLCPTVVGPKENHGCPSISILSDLGKNTCIAYKAKTSGIIIGEPICSICPCDNHISILTPARSCDIVFPTILSLDQKTVFSRGPLYQIQ